MQPLRLPEEISQWFGWDAKKASEERSDIELVIHRSDIAVIASFAAVAYSVSYYKQRCRCAPHLAKVAPMGPAPAQGAMLAAALYASNIAYNVMNKRVLDGHPYPLLLTTVNFGTCSLCCVLAWAVGLQPWPRIRPSFWLCLRLVPLALLHYSGILLANISVSGVSLALTHTVKSAEPFFTAVAAWLFLGAQPDHQSIFGLLLIAAGVSIASGADTSFAWPGFLSAMLSNVCVSLRNVMTKSLFTAQGDKEHPRSEEEELWVGDPLTLAAVLHCMAFLLSSPLALFMEGRQLPSLFSARQSCLIPLVGVLVWVFNMASFAILSRVSPVTHSVIRSLRRPVLIMSSIAAFGTPVPSLNAIGLVLALLGAWLCTGM